MRKPIGRSLLLTFIKKKKIKVKTTEVKKNKLLVSVDPYSGHHKIGEP